MLNVLKSIPIKRWQSFIKPKILILLGVLVLLPINFLYDGGGSFEKVREVFHVCSLLFGILIVSAVGMAYGKYREVKTLIAGEVGKLTSLYYTSSIISKKAQEKVGEAIERYITNSLDYLLIDYVKFTEDELNKILETIRKLNINNTKGGPAYGSIISTFSGLTELREKIRTVTSTRLGTLQWSTVLILGVSLIYLLQYIKSSSTVSALISFFLSLSIIVLLAVLFSLDNLTWFEEHWSWEPYEDLLEQMGKLRYYPRPAIGTKVKPPKDKPYRVAYYFSPYPDTSKKRVIVVLPKPKKRKMTRI